MLAAASHGSSRSKAGTNSGEDPLPSQGHSHPPHTHSDQDNVDTVLTECAHFWDVGGRQSTKRKLTQTSGEMQTAHRPVDLELIFSHRQDYNETILNEATLFPNLLPYFKK